MLAPPASAREPTASRIHRRTGAGNRPFEVHMDKKPLLRCTSWNGLLKLEFPYDQMLIWRIKTLAGRKYHSMPDGVFWTVPPTPKNVAQILDMGFPVPTEWRTATPPKKAKLDWSTVKMELRPYQKAGVERIAGELDLRGLLADEMGLGKTAQALACIAVRNAFPALVICPSSLKWNWAREAVKWLDNVNVRVVSGYCQRRSWKTRKREICIVNDDVMADVENKYGEVTRKGWARVFSQAGFKTIILDECHRMKNNKKKTVYFIDENGKEKSKKVPACKRSHTVLTLAKTVDCFLALSGTPIESRPSEFFPVLNVLNPEVFPSFWHFAHKFCGAKNNGFGWTFAGSSNEQELHGLLTASVMVRRLKKDVLKELPEKIRTVVPVEIDLKEYIQAETDVLSYVAKLEGKTPEFGKASAEALAKIERLKQAAVAGKMDEACAWISDYLESGRKLVVFATHKFVLDALQKEFGKICVRVDGSTSINKRQDAVDAFQGDAKIRLFLGNIKAAGVGLTLTAASDTLTLELGWTPGLHDQAEDRVHRIGQEADSVTAYYLIAKDTIEEDIAQLLDEKRDVLKGVMDGKSAGKNEMLMHLLKNCERRIKERE